MIAVLFSKKKKQKYVLGKVQRNEGNAIYERAETGSAGEEEVSVREIQDTITIEHT